MSKDYYKTLGVDKSASQDEIKKAFRKQAHKHHPDKQGGDEAKFKEANEAYQVLSDKTKRAQYDQYGSNANQAGGGMNWQDFAQGQAGGFDMGDLGDIFSDMFGGGGRQQRRSQRGSDLEVAINLTFKEAIFGVEKEISLKRVQKCKPCNGDGAEPGTALETCGQCKGAGSISVSQNVLFGQVQSQRICPTCNGRGQSPKQRCAACVGEGIKSGSEEIKIKIPAGINSGEVIRLGGYGNAGLAGSSSGDLYVHIRADKHSDFVREHETIHSTHTIKLWQAILGDKVKISTIDGDITLKIPEGTQSHTLFRLKGHGVPHLKGRGRGDHYVEMHVEIPTKLTKSQRDIVKQLKSEEL